MDEEEEFDEAAAEAQAEKLEVLRPVIDKLNEGLEEIGLYVEGIAVGATLSDPEIFEQMSAKEIVEEGEGAFIIVGNYRINKVAWTDRVLDPEGYALRTQVDSTVTVETHIDRAKAATEAMKKTLAEGIEDEAPTSE